MALQKNRWLTTAAILAAASTALAQTAPLTFDDKGAKVGEQLPNLALRSLDDEPLQLADEAPGLTLIVTSSFTCPKSRQYYPDVAALASKYKDKLKVVILYVIEAHPAGDPSPYRGKEDITPENERDGILRRQPTAMEKRLTLANAFKDRLNIKLPILVDGMENWAWKSVGAGPNMAILVNGNRTVVARQGWFNAAALSPLIDNELAKKTAPRPDGPFATDHDKAFFEVLVKDKVVDDSLFFPAHRFLDPKDPEKLAGLLKKYPELSRFVMPYQARGDSGGETLLHAAIRAGNAPAVKSLFDSDAIADKVTPWRASPVTLAAEKGDEEIVRLVLRNSKVQPTSDLMEIAFLGDHKAAAELFAKAGAKETFYTQVARGNLDAVKKLLDADESLAGRPDSRGNTPLDYAAATGQTAMVALLTGIEKKLLQLQADEKAVILAVLHHHPETLGALLNAGGNPNSLAGPLQGRALHIASRDKDSQAVQLLLKAGAKTETSDSIGMTPLHWAEDLATIKLLLDAGANVNAKQGDVVMPCGPPPGNADETTPLQSAAKRGSLEVVKLLLQRGARVDMEDTEGRAALDFAEDAAVRKALEQAGAKKGSGKPHKPEATPDDGLGSYRIPR